MGFNSGFKGLSIGALPRMRRSGKEAVEGILGGLNDH